MYGTSLRGRDPLFTALRSVNNVVSKYSKSISERAPISMQKAGLKFESILRRPSIAIFVCFVVVSAAIAVDMNAITLSNEADEGVYWQSLRAMSAGYRLYSQIFYSQPPLFLISIYPFYELLGSTITAARVGIATLSLLGLIGAYLMGRAFGGRAVGIAAILLLVVTPIYLEQAHVLRAEGPSTGLMVLAVGAAFMWWEYPIGRPGTAYCTLSATALATAVLIKLLAVTAIVPIVLLALARMWQIRNETTANIRGNLRPLGVATIIALFVTFAILAPYLHSLNSLMDQVVKFHLAAKKMMVSLESDNVQILSRFFANHIVLSGAATVGVIVTIARRDWRIVPLLGWFLTTLVLLRIQVPLWSRHVIVLVPPMIAVVALGLNGFSTELMRRWLSWEQRATLLMGILTCAVVLTELRYDYRHYRDLGRQKADPVEHSMVELAGDLQKTTTRDQWIVTDAQYVAAMANRDVPPWLVDTSITRVMSKYLTTQDLTNAASDPRVHTIVFATGHFTLPQVADFHPWVKEHFDLWRSYGNGIEVWTR
jgi:4-amino-4-deoxy-L-arabinose transferase-like glycosyltransferase